MSTYDFSLDLETVNTMSVINSWIIDGSKILEFGPANGRLTKHLNQERKCTVTIVEIDVQAGNEASLYASCAFVGAKHGNIDNLYWYDCTQQYDYIIFADVLEHLTNPKKILNICKELLTPQGKILISIPNIAHNSVLIDLLNDKFNYSATGLLDKTHIHFFTYHSFFQMIQEIGLAVTEQKPIYSQVGWNEINNHYDDVPFEVEQLLRNRQSGSIYQYVYCLSKTEESEYSLNFNDIEPLKDNFKQEEASCYMWNSNPKMDLPDRLSFVYYNNEKEHSFRFEINFVPSKIRIDIIETSGLVKINYIKAKLKGKATNDIYVNNHNALYNISNIFLFADEDPWIELDMTAIRENTVEYVEIQFVILDSHLSEKHITIYSNLFASFYSDLAQDNSCAQYAFQRNCEKEMVAAKEYIDHLENDIRDLNDKFKNNAYELEKYNEHLANDIATLKQDLLMFRERYSSREQELEAQIREQQQYISHLENDIGTLKQNLLISRKQYSSREQELEAQIKEQQQYIAHLENDIGTLKQNLLISVTPKT